MQTGAVIVAAGLSSRMGDFKPMLNIGSISIAQRVIATLRQAGVGKIVVVTGYNAAALERHLANLGVIFLRNNDFATTQMFDSAKIGLEYIQDKCDQILFTPVDIPLFTSATVETLIASGSPLACPTCEGQTGHPMLMSTKLIPQILQDDGPMGLRGAITRLPVPLTEVPVNDPGVLMDADTMEDYDALLQYHNRQLTRPQVSAAIAREVTFFDEKIAMLLELVEETASVRTACQRMQISYSTGWNIIRVLESQLSYPLVIRSQGGPNGGQSTLTEYGKQLLDLYRGFMDELQHSVDNLYKKYFGEVF